jgi:hypothetical protein
MAAAAQFLSTYRGRKEAYTPAKAQPKPQWWGKAKDGINSLDEDEVRQVYERLVKAADYVDLPGCRRPNVWGMLAVAVRNVVKRNPEGLTLAEITLRMGEGVTTKDVAWALGKLIGSNNVQRVIHGDLNFTVYRPAPKRLRK